MELLILLIILLFWIAPIALTIAIASSRGRSARCGCYGWWAVGLGWVGAIIGIVVVLVQAERPQPGAVVQGTLGAFRWHAHYVLGGSDKQWETHARHCRDCTSESPSCKAGQRYYNRARATQ